MLNLPNDCKNKLKIKNTMDRPKIKDFFTEGTSVKKAHARYVAAPELYNYIQALDTYIDEIEKRIDEVNKTVFVNSEKCKHEFKPFTVGDKCIYCGVIKF